MKSHLFWFWPICFLLLVSCHPEPDSLKLFDQLVVQTNYDTNADFKSYSTYSISTDTIGLISNQSSDTIITAGESDFPRPVLNLVKSNMDSRGYTRVDRSQSPDLGVRVMVVNNLNLFQSVIYPNYYGGLYGGYYSGYYGYSSWYSYPYVSTYAYNTGVLIVEIVDLKNRTANNEVAVIWDAYLGDIYSTLDQLNESLDAINQAFTQSPYLSK
jgi:hypothetical protein